MTTRLFSKMLKPIAYNFLPIWLLLSITACREDLAPIEVAKGELLFDLEFITETGGRAETSGEPYQVLISITSEGEKVLDLQKMDIMKWSGFYALSPILLDEGDYELTEFMVLNAANEVIYATPMEGAQYAPLVSSALPKAFSITGNEAIRLQLETVTTEDVVDPRAFGYSAVFFQIVQTVDLKVAIMEVTDVSADLVGADLEVFVDDQLVFEQELGASINVVRVRRDYQSVKLTATLADGRAKSVTLQRQDFDNYVEVPLEFIFASAARGLYALAGEYLALLDTITGKVFDSYQISNLPSSGTLRRMTYHEEDQVFYVIKDHTTNPVLCQISLDAIFSEIGPITHNGEQLTLTEGLAYDAESNRLYLTASLNGGPSSDDFTCESLLTIDPSSAEATFVTEMDVDIATQPEAGMDEITIHNGKLVFIDGAPPGANFLKIFEINLSDLNEGGLSSPSMVFETTYLEGVRIALSNETLYTAIGRVLYELNIDNPMPELIGITHGKGPTIDAIAFVR